MDMLQPTGTIFDMKNILKWLSAIILVILAFCAFEVYASKNILTVNSISYSSEKIDTPVRIIILSDLHNHDFGAKLPEMVKEQNPDLILMAGDMIDHDRRDEEQVLQIVREMSAIAPVYYALGNHEKDYMKENPDLINRIEFAGAVFVDRAYKTVLVKNNEIRIGGMYDYPFDLANNNSASAPEEIRTFMEDYTDTASFKVFMAHRPDSFVFGDVSKVYDIDLVVSGHMHGGQVIIPFVGGLYGGDLGWFPKYYHGMYEKDRIHLLITSGLGSSKKRLPRFNNRPEIMVLDVK